MINNTKQSLIRILKSRANLFHFKVLKKYFKVLLVLKLMMISLSRRVHKIKSLYKILSLQKFPIIYRKEVRSLERSNIKIYKKIDKCYIIYEHSLFIII
jgi:hypothetical protein